MNGKQIANSEVKNLPVGTKLLIHSLEDQDCWFECTLVINENGLHLIERHGIFAYLAELNDNDEIYEYNEEDAGLLIKKTNLIQSDETDEPDELNKVQIAIENIQEELQKAVVKYSPFNSAHEGYAVLLEELDELWDQVKTKPRSRSIQAMREEAVQIAAMAVRFIIDCC